MVISRAISLFESFDFFPVRIVYRWTSIKYPPIKCWVNNVQLQLISPLILTFICLKVNIHKQNDKGFLNRIFMNGEN